MWRKEIEEVEKPKLGVIADWPYAATGFGNVSKSILTPLLDRYDIYILAINYSGDYHPSQKDFKYYHVGNHIYGINRIPYFLETAAPDVLLIIQDPFIADKLITKVRTVAPDLPCILYTPVDSPNIAHKYVNLLNQFQAVVAYTEFGRNELLKSGLQAPCYVIPHGVDTDTFYPVDRDDARRKLDLPDDNRFIVGYVATNQARKKIDVWLYTINEWLKRYPHDDVYVYYHGQIRRQGGLDIPQYVEEYLDVENARQGYDLRLSNRIMVTDDSEYFVMGEEFMKYMYNALDVYFHGTAVEGLAN